MATSFSSVMPAAAPLMDPAPAAPKSSLEIMLDTIRERDEQRQDDNAPFLPPSPARPRGRGRPPTSARWPLPTGFKVGNGEGAGASTVPVEEKPDVGRNGATISDDGDAGVVRPATVILIGNGNSHDTESPCIRVEGGIMISDDGAADVIVHSTKQQDPESEINVDDERSLHDAIIVVPGGGSPTASASSIARVGRRTPQQSSGSVSPPRSSSSSSRESEPEERTKAGVGELLWCTTFCVRAPVAALTTLVLNSCGSSSRAVRALVEQTGRGAETSPRDAAMKSPAVPSGGGDTDPITVKAKVSAASSVSRSGVVRRWLKKIFGRLRDVRDVEETTKAGLRQRTSRSTPQPWIN